jgi:uncharacterized protein YjbJ (UPF0337 family)
MPESALVDPVLAPAPSPPRSAPAAAGRSRQPHYLPQVFLATSLVAVFPTLAVWWLRASGTLSSYPLGAALGMSLSLAAAYGGRTFWQTRAGSKDILFGDLMLWGYGLRLYREHRLRSARAVLGMTSQAQLRMPDGLAPEHQVKLLEQLAGALDARDPTTHGHSGRVARYSWMIASRMGLAGEQVARIRAAAAVHDVGKIETPIDVLRKPGALTDEEYEVMKRHAADGARMVAVLNDPDLTAMVMHHHERLDGSGYPAGLRGDDIPLGARIIAVADTFDAMTADRPYRTGRAHKQALDVLRGEAGTKLDADAVRAFCSNYSGRRSIAVWSSLTTIPSRLASVLTSSAGGVAATVKTVAVAALVGSFASSASSLARPVSRGHESAGVHVNTSSVTPTADALKKPGGAGAQTSAALRSHPGRTTSSASQAGAANPATGGSVQASAPGQTRAAAGAAASVAQGSPSEGAPPTPSSPEGAPKRHGEETRDSGGGGSSSQPVQATKPETTAKTSEPIKTTVQETAGKVNEVVGKVTGKVEETTKKVSEVTGKVTGKVEEVKSKAEETTKETLKETTNKVGEIIKKL